MEEDTRVGKTLFDGRYVIVQHLLSRPRLSLYLGRKQADQYTQGPLVGIRELMLSDFTPIIRAQVEAAAIEEFAHPTVFGSSRLPNAGDRIWCERDRLYLAVQLDEGWRAGQDVQSVYAHNSQKMQNIPIAYSSHLSSISSPALLDNLLRDAPDWPEWLIEQLAFEWGIQLCRMVARLHRQGVVLGNLNPCVIYVHEIREERETTERDEEQKHQQVIRTPLLLPCWPPAPCYWQGSSHKSHTYQLFAAHDYVTAFPTGRSERENAFVAPEMLYESGEEVTERADIYSLGALLYLLLTHFAPVSAASRLSSLQHPSSVTFPIPLTGSLIQPPTYSIMTTPMPVQRRETGARFERRRPLHHSRLLRAVTSPHRGYNVFTDEREEVGLDLPDPHSLNSNISIACANIIMRALDLDARERFTSAFEMVEALEAIPFA